MNVPILPRTFLFGGACRILRENNTAAFPYGIADVFPLIFLITVLFCRMLLRVPEWMYVGKRPRTKQSKEYEGMIRKILKKFLKNKDEQPVLSRGLREPERRLIELCQMTPAKALESLESSSAGLTADEAERRLGEFGLNELSHLKHLSFFADMAHRFSSPLVVQLLVIAIVSAITGDMISAGIVSAMIVLSVGLAAILDRKSNMAVEALGKRVQSRTLVIRDGAECEVRISKVVPGDIVLLYAGSDSPGRSHPDFGKGLLRRRVCPYRRGHAG